MIAANGVGITGGRGAAPIWTRFMTEALKSEPVRDFPVSGNLSFETVDIRTGCAPGFFGGEETEKVPLLPDQELCLGEVP